MSVILRSPHFSQTATEFAIINLLFIVKIWLGAPILGRAQPLSRFKWSFNTTLQSCSDPKRVPLIYRDQLQDLSSKLGGYGFSHVECFRNEMPWTTVDHLAPGNDVFSWLVWDHGKEPISTFPLPKQRDGYRPHCSAKRNTDGDCILGLMLLEVFL